MKSVSVLMLVSLLVAADKPQEEKKVPDKLQGYWALRGWTRLDGSGGTTSAYPDWGLTIKGDKAEWGAIPGAMKKGKGALSVDATKTPPQIELKVDDQTYKGVYKLDENGLNIAFSAPGGDYPEKVESKKEKVFTISFQRLKKK